MAPRRSGSTRPPHLKVAPPPESGQREAVEVERARAEAHAPLTTSGQVTITLTHEEYIELVENPAGTSISSTSPGFLGMPAREYPATSRARRSSPPRRSSQQRSAPHGPRRRATRREHHSELHDTPHGQRGRLVRAQPRPALRQARARDRTPTAARNRSARQRIDRQPQPRRRRPAVHHKPGAATGGRRRVTSSRTARPPRHRSLLFAAGEQPLVA